jgi:hypothetical protein
MMYKGFVVAMLTFTFAYLVYIGNEMDNKVDKYEKEGVLQVVEYDCYIKSAVLPITPGWDPDLQLAMVCRREVSSITDEDIGEPPTMYVEPPIPLPETEGT